MAAPAADEELFPEDDLWGTETPSDGLLDVNGTCAQRLPALPWSEAPRERHAPGPLWLVSHDKLGECPNQGGDARRRALYVALVLRAEGHHLISTALIDRHPGRQAAATKTTHVRLPVRPYGGPGIEPRSGVVRCSAGDSAYHCCSSRDDRRFSSIDIADQRLSAAPCRHPCSRRGWCVSLGTNIASGGDGAALQEHYFPAQGAVLRLLYALWNRLRAQEAPSPPYPSRRFPCSEP
jgi:hypothetical protein